SAATGIVKLARNQPPLGPAVTFTSSDTSVVPSPLPVTVPIGSTTSPNFAIQTTPVSFDSSLTLTATYGTSQISTTIKVLHPKPNQLTSTPTPGRGGSVTMGVAKLDAPAPAGGALVPFPTTNPPVAPPPSSVTVPAGATASPSFAVATNPVGSITNVILT